MKSPITALLALSVALTATLVCRASGDQFLAPEKAFQYLATIDGGELTVQWNAAPGYYLYKSRMALESATPGVTLAPARFPKGDLHHDEYFGDQEIFRDDFVVRASLQTKDSQMRQMKLKLKWQGCADAGLCYPITIWETTVALSPKSP